MGDLCSPVLSSCDSLILGLVPAMPDTGPFPLILRHLRQQASTLALLAAIIWGAEMLDQVLSWISDIHLDSWGIRPRQMAGLTGILFAPLLHVDFNHVAANSLPLLVLASLILLEGPRLFWQATGLIALVSGSVVWVLGRYDSVYIGASGLVFGYLGYVFMRAWVTRRPLWISLAIVCSIVYGGLAMSLLTVTEGISWLGHLSGLVSGMLAARWLHEKHTGLIGHRESQ